MTPLSEPWIYNELWQPSSTGERKDIECFMMDILDNCTTHGGFLTPEAIEEFERDLDDDVKEARLRGKFRHLIGRVYNDFDPAVHVVPRFDIPAHWPVYGGIDPHLRKEHAYSQWTINPQTGNIIACNEIYQKHTIEELGKEILEMEKGKKMIWRVIDSSAETPDSIYRETPRRVLERMGVTTRLATKHNMIDHGIHVMKTLLKPSECNDGIPRPKFFVMDHCKRHIAEFMNYVYDTRDTEYVIKDKPRKIWDDFMDLDRYFVITNPHGSTNAKPIRMNSHKYTR